MSLLSSATVTLTERPDRGYLTRLPDGALTGRVMAAADGPPVLDPPGFIPPPTFTVLSGPCTVAEGGRCVGRWPGGYLPSEDCEIAVAGVPGALGPCPVFDTDGDSLDGHGDSLTLPDGSRHFGADCPAGAALAAGQRLAWHSDHYNQGNNRNGLPFSHDGAGGGWQVCFA